MITVGTLTLCHSNFASLKRLSIMFPGKSVLGHSINVFDEDRSFSVRLRLYTSYTPSDKERVHANNYM